jgi:glutamyl-tRNA synthetase
MSEVRVRFPPSPTGYLHIGGARTAIYNWLFARKHHGTFILRIEDTDVERSTQESIQGIIDGLEWLGIDWDEGPYFQTDHAAEHVAAANRLVAEGRAYKCFCTKEELEEKRRKAVAAKADYKYDRTCRDLSASEIMAREKDGLPAVVRFKVPDRPGTVSFEDQVYGLVERAYVDIEDFVILRSNGTPLYLLSNVVDDMRDRITHVIRGQDGLTNTPRQILLYEGLGGKLPVFAHMPLTLDLHRAKISKRSHGEVVAVQFYRDHGFIPWALANFLVLLGWSSGDDREIFSREELIESFSLDGITRANSIFNYRAGDPKFFTDPKALSINAHYLRTMPLEKLGDMVSEELKKDGLWNPQYAGEKKEWFLAAIDLIRSRFHTLKDFTSMGRAYFADDYEVEAQAVAKNLLKEEGLKEWLTLLADRYQQLPVFSREETEKTLRELAAELNVKPGLLINGARTVITGRLAGPGMFEVLEIIGRESVVARLRKTAEFYQEAGEK